MRKVKIIDTLNAVMDALSDLRLIHSGVWADGVCLLPQSTKFVFATRKPRKYGDDAIIKLETGQRVKVRLLKGSDNKRWLVVV